MNTANLLSALLGALVAAIPLLAYVASKTKNTVDDAVVKALKEYLPGIGTSPVAKTEPDKGIGTSPTN